ncbi:hypothetical protein STEG23_031210, partial [Scotinomys teguina]
MKMCVEEQDSKAICLSNRKTIFINYEEDIKEQFVGKRKIQHSSRGKCDALKYSTYIQ